MQNREKDGERDEGVNKAAQKRGQENDLVSFILWLFVLYLSSSFLCSKEEGIRRIREKEKSRVAYGQQPAGGGTIEEVYGQ